MKLITRETDYAIRALCCIARREGQIVPVKELVERLKVPRPFIRKLMQALTREGLLKSYKGKGGGFEFAARPGNIAVTHILEIFQGPLQLSDHRFKRGLCHERKRCPFRKKLDKLEKYIKRELSGITIGLLLKEGKRLKWLRER